MHLFKRLFKVEWNGVFLFVISFLFQRYSSFRIMQIWSLMTSSVVKIQLCETISPPIKLCYCDLCRNIPPYRMYQMVHILMLPWQNARFQSPASSKWNITNFDTTRQYTWWYLSHMPVPPSLGFLFNIFKWIYFPTCSYKWYYLILRGKELEPSMLP